MLNIKMDVLRRETKEVEKFKEMLFEEIHKILIPVKNDENRKIVS